MVRIKHVALMAAVITTASVGLASPALASTTVTVTGGGVSGGPVSDSTVTIVNSTGGNINFVSDSLSTTVGTSVVCSAANGGCGAPSSGVGVAYAIAPGTVGVTVTVTTVPAPGTTIGTFVVTYVGGGSSSSSSGSSGPAPVVQQFGMPATGTCDEARPEGLNWSGVANGGWGVSWAQWLNGGAGGAVCTRTLVYSTAQSKWIVN